MNSLNEEDRAAYRKAQEDLRVAEREALTDLKSVALEIVKAGYRDLAKKHHPDMGGDAETMRKLTDANKELDYLIQRKWRRV